MAPLAMALNLGYANAPASMAGAEEQQAEGTVAALEVAMVPGQDALGVVDMAMPKASLIEVHQQLGPEVQKLQDREDGAAAEQQPQSGDVALAERALCGPGAGARADEAAAATAAGALCDEEPPLCLGAAACMDREEPSEWTGACWGAAHCLW